MSDKITDLLDSLQAFKKTRRELLNHDSIHNLRLRDAQGWLNRVNGLLSDPEFVLYNFKEILRSARDVGVLTVDDLTWLVDRHKEEERKLNACRDFIRTLCPHLSPAAVYHDPEAAVQTVREHLLNPEPTPEPSC